MILEFNKKESKHFRESIKDITKISNTPSMLRGGLIIGENANRIAVAKLFGDLFDSIFVASDVNIINFNDNLKDIIKLKYVDIYGIRYVSDTGKIYFLMSDDINDTEKVIKIGKAKKVDLTDYKLERPYQVLSSEHLFIEFSDDEYDTFKANKNITRIKTDVTDVIITKGLLHGAVRKESEIYYLVESITHELFSVTLKSRNQFVDVYSLLHCSLL